MAFSNSGIIPVVFQVEAITLTSVLDHNQVNEVINFYYVQCSKL